MITVHIRKQGGAAIMTIPSDVLKMLNLHVGTTLEIAITDNEFIARPVSKTIRKRYSLSELLRGVTTAKMKTLNKKTKWAREGNPKGREIS